MDLKARKVKLCWQNRVFYAICYIVTAILTVVVLYPIVYIVSASFSSGSAITSGKVFLYPVDISLLGYKAVLKYQNVWIGYRNTLLYTVAGTFINVCLTLLCAYPLARKNLRGRGFFTMIFTFTMIFSGGMIPHYILMKKLGLINTIWSMLLPGGMSVYNMIVARTFIQNNIPDEMIEAARIDGCSDIRQFYKIVLPLSKAIIAVLALWYAVGHWNSYFNAFLYLSDKNLYPLQIFLKDILVQSSFNSDLLDPDIVAQMENLKTVLKYSMIVISTAPLFCFYPFVQKYFVRGVMIGSVKG